MYSNSLTQWRQMLQCHIHASDALAVPALAYMSPPSNYNNWSSIFWRPFFSRRHLRAQFSNDFFSLVVALNNHRHTSARAHKMFTLPNMRPLSIREASPPWGTGGPSVGSAYHKIDQHGSSSCKSTFGLLYSMGSNTMIFAVLKGWQILCSALHYAPLCRSIPIVS